MPVAQAMATSLHAPSSPELVLCHRTLLLALSIRSLQLRGVRMQDRLELGQLEASPDPQFVPLLFGKEALAHARAKW